MRDVDRLAVEQFGLDLLQMMENAGRALAEVARRMLGSRVQDRSLFVAAGRGNNGGGGLAAARHLANWGARVTALVEAQDRLTSAPGQQLQAARAAGATVTEGGAAITAVRAGVGALLIDALIGYGLQGAPRGWTAELITRVNLSGIPVLSLDVPSGLDATTGVCPGPCIRAAATLTLALPKTGLLTAEGRAASGRLYLADIGITPALYSQLGLAVGPIFARESIVIVNG